MTLHLPDPTGDGEILDRIGARLRSARRVQIVGHVRPDGDCFGSVLAMSHLLRGWDIETAMAIGQLRPTGYEVLPGFESIRESPDPAFAPELVVFLDTATQERGPEGWTPNAPIVNIDHHHANTRYGDLNWIQPACAATCEMLLLFAERMGAEITATIADAMLIGLMTDTGGFRYGNTGIPQHLAAARLIQRGARSAEMARIAYGSQSLENLRLGAAVMSRLQLAAGGRIAWSELRADELERHGGEVNMPENIADQLRAIRGVELAILFSEPRPGLMRTNLRSHCAVDASRLAATWGGGGHPGAAGLTMENVDFATRRDEILARAIRLIESDRVA